MMRLSRRDLRVLVVALGVPCLTLALATAAHRLLPAPAASGGRPERVVARLLVGVLLAVVLARRRSVRAALTDFFATTASATHLAVFRIVVFVTLLAFFVVFGVGRVVWLSELPAVLRTPPTGMGFLVRVLPIDAASATVAGLLFCVACLTAAAGLASRASAALAAVLGVYVLGILHLFGHASHSTHHLIWFAALLAVSPCGDALSLDAWRARRRSSGPPPATRAYALPLRFAWLLLGVVYFFPGLWKAANPGLEWAFGDSLGNVMTLTWLRDGGVPPWRVDRWPGLLHAGALGTILFELSFGVLIFSPRLRWLGIAGALAFHNLAGVFLGISFWTLQTCLLALPDWQLTGRAREPVRRAAATPVEGSAAPPARSWPIVTVGVLLLCVNAVFGALAFVAAWPFACYPVFGQSVGTEIPALSFVAEWTDGTTRRVQPTAERALTRHLAPTRHDAQTRAFALEKIILATEDPALRHARLQAYWTVWARVDPGAAGARTVRVYEDTLSTVPERWAENPIRRESIDTLTPP